MILIAHLLFGALIGERIKNPFLAIVLALLGHYLLDLIPHIDYPIENLHKKQWRKSLPDILKIIADVGTATLLIFIFSKNQPIIYICSFFAILPDGLTVITSISNQKILSRHTQVHTEKIHFLKNKKISVFWRILSQAAVVLICVVLLKF